ncbi:TNF receptor-associated factor 4-like [Dysidea avara]|uniref:TNF receptor-associated factor 4-like n=1 Tax=Dysidea avara TaxID=196820 RepID=UPI003321BFB6
MASGGYDYDFTTDVPDRLVCKICQLASRDPHLSVCCGHIFCKTCVDGVKNSYHTSCPMCRNRKFSTVLNKQADREVKDLTVYCINDECTWKGKVRGVSAHGKTCNYESVQCEYYWIGCRKRLYRKDRSDHNKKNAEEHLALSVRKLKNLEHITHQLTMGGMIKSWSMQLSVSSMLTTSSSDLVCPIIVKMPEYSIRKRDNKDWYSNSFYSHDNGYKMCLNVCATGEGDGEGTHLSVFLCFMKGPHDDELTWPLGEEFEMKLLNQIKDFQHHSKTIDYDHEDADDDIAGRVIDGSRSNGWGQQEFISHKHLQKITPTCQYLKDDCIFLQVSRL